MKLPQTKSHQHWWIKSRAGRPRKSGLWGKCHLVKGDAQVATLGSGRILLILTGPKSSRATNLDPPNRLESVRWCPNEARGEFYRVSLPGSRETDGPVIVAEARIGEFGSSASRKMMPFSRPEIGKWKNEKCVKNKSWSESMQNKK